MDKGLTAAERIMAIHLQAQKEVASVIEDSTKEFRGLVTKLGDAFNALEPEVQRGLCGSKSLITLEEIVSMATPKGGKSKKSESIDGDAAVLAFIATPQKQGDIQKKFGFAAIDLKAVLTRLESDGKAKMSKDGLKKMWIAEPAKT